MTTINLSITANLYVANSAVDAVSGASGYAPQATSAPDPAAAAVRREVRASSQDFKALRDALQANDTAGAGTAYATLQQDIQKISQAAGGKSPFDVNSAVTKDFQALGDALKSGDLDGAKKAFADFRQDLRKAAHAGRTHGHHRPYEAGQAGAAASAESTTPEAASAGAAVSPASSTLDATA